MPEFTFKNLLLLLLQLGGVLTTYFVLLLQYQIKWTIIIHCQILSTIIHWVIFYQLKSCPRRLPARFYQLSSIRKSIGAYHTILSQLMYIVPFSKSADHAAPFQNQLMCIVSSQISGCNGVYCISSNQLICILSSQISGCNGEYCIFLKSADVYSVISNLWL